MSQTTFRFGKRAGVFVQDRARLYVPAEEQNEANLYWAQHEHKKWVVLFTRGHGKRRESYECYVAGANRDRALAAGRSYAKLVNHPWAGRSNAAATVRLATYRDLGATRTVQVLTKGEGSADTFAAKVGGFRGHEPMPAASKETE